MPYWTTSSSHGPTAYRIKFGEAVEQKLLTDKVVVLPFKRMPSGTASTFFESDQGVNAMSLEPRTSARLSVAGRASSTRRAA